MSRSFFQKKPCHEIGPIMDYVNARLNGAKPTQQPTPQYDIHQGILGEFNRLLDNEEAISIAGDRLLVESSKLSSFDVEMSFMAEQITDFAEEMLSVSESNMAMVEETTASMDQVNDSIQVHSKTLDKITSQSKELIDLNLESKEQMEVIGNLKDEVVHDANEMSDKIATLIEMINKVNEIVQGVEGIAGQTNLLALNASIEAARAGEHGRGFAVVAEEIRKLADDTKTNLDGMRTFMTSIKIAANQGKESMDNTLNSTIKMSEKMEVVHSSIDENVVNLQSTVENIHELSAAMKDITAATDEINAAMRSAASESEKISDMTQAILSQAKTAKGSADKIAHIDDSLTEITKDIMHRVAGGIHAMDNAKLIKYLNAARKSHQEWVENLKNMVDSGELMPLQTNSTKCAFGHFYHSMEINNPNIQKEWEEIDRYHVGFHKQGDVVIAAIKKKDSGAARQALQEVRGYSEKIFALLDAITQKLQ